MQWKKKQCTALSNCASGMNISMMKLLLKAGAHVHISDYKRRTALHRANGVALLLDAGASVNAIDDEGNTPLHFAASRGDMDVVMCLIRSGGNALLMNDQGQTAADIFGRDSGSWGFSAEDIVVIKCKLTSLACQVLILFCNHFTHHVVTISNLSYIYI